MKTQITRDRNLDKNDLSWILLRLTVKQIYYNQIEVEIKLLINKKWQVTFGFKYI